MSAIGPGSLLLCVKDWLGDPRSDPAPLPRLVLGRVYECFSIGEGYPGCDDCGSPAEIDLVETGQHPEWAYCSCQFAPAGRRGDFTGLLTPADAPAEPERVNA